MVVLLGKNKDSILTVEVGSTVWNNANMDLGTTYKGSVCHGATKKKNVSESGDSKSLCDDADNNLVVVTVLCCKIWVKLVEY